MHPPARVASTPVDPMRVYHHERCIYPSDDGAAETLEDVAVFLAGVIHLGGACSNASWRTGGATVQLTSVYPAGALARGVAACEASVGTTTWGRCPTERSEPSTHDVNGDPGTTMSSRSGSPT